MMKNSENKAIVGLMYKEAFQRYIAGLKVSKKYVTSADSTSALAILTGRRSKDKRYARRLMREYAANSDQWDIIKGEQGKILMVRAGTTKASVSLKQRVREYVAGFSGDSFTYADVCDAVSGDDYGKDEEAFKKSVYAFVPEVAEDLGWVKVRKGTSAFATVLWAKESTDDDAVTNVCGRPSNIKDDVLEFLKSRQKPFTHNDVNAHLNKADCYASFGSYASAVRSCVNRYAPDYGWERAEGTEGHVVWKRCGVEDAVEEAGVTLPTNLNYIGRAVKEFLDGNFMSESKVAAHLNLDQEVFSAFLEQRYPLSPFVADKLSTLPGLHKVFSSTAADFSGRTLMMRNTLEAWDSYVQESV